MGTDDISKKRGRGGEKALNKWREGQILAAASHRAVSKKTLHS